MKRKLLSLFLTLCLTLTFVPTVSFAADFTDTAGHWAEAPIRRWSSAGILQGSNGEFRPNNALTCAHLAAILSRLLNLPEAPSAGMKDVAPDA